MSAFFLFDLLYRSVLVQILSVRMKNFTNTTLLSVFILLGLFCNFEASEEDLKENHLCPRIERVLEKHVVPQTILKKEPYYTQCSSFPPLCYKYKYTKIKENKTAFLNITRTVFSCCPGYEKVNGSCTPVCLLGCQHGECLRSNFCNCDPGWKGPLCSSACLHGFWGKNCMNECFCFNDASCNISTGECICLPGWIGPNCSEPSPSAVHSVNCSDECNFTEKSTCNTTNDLSGSILANICILLPAAIIAVILVILVVSSICYCLRRKYLSSGGCCSKSQEYGESGTKVIHPAVAHLHFIYNSLEARMNNEAKKFCGVHGQKSATFISKGLHYPSSSNDLEFDVLY